MSFAKKFHCQLSVLVLMFLVVSMKVAAQTTESKLRETGVPLGVQRVEKKAHVRYGTRDNPAESCADLLTKRNDSVSDYYWVKPIMIPSANTVYEVYCDMNTTTFGGGWTLVVGIDGLSRKHLESGPVEKRCEGGDRCVTHETTGAILATKLNDSVIRALAAAEGTFRIDVGPNRFTTFFRLSQGPKHFNSSCEGKGCPRIITSHAPYPYEWESNCKGIETGYHVKDNKYKVFDNHDSGECGPLWESSRCNSSRVLYGHADSTGICSRQQGFMYVR